MTEPELKLETFLPYRLSVLSNQVSQGIAETYAQRFGLSVTEWRVIAILGRFPRSPASQIVERSAMDKVAISRAVRRLLDSGLVRRERDESDRRARPLSLSGEGMKVYATIVPAALAYERRLLDALTNSERQAFQNKDGRLMSDAMMNVCVIVTDEDEVYWIVKQLSSLLSTQSTHLVQIIHMQIGATPGSIGDRVHFFMVAGSVSLEYRAIRIDRQLTIQSF